MRHGSPVASSCHCILSGSVSHGPSPHTDLSNVRYSLVSTLFSFGFRLTATLTRSAALQFGKALRSSVEWSRTEPIIIGRFRRKAAEQRRCPTAIAAVLRPLEMAAARGACDCVITVLAQRRLQLAHPPMRIGVVHIGGTAAL